MNEQPNAKGYTRTQCRNGGLARARNGRKHPTYKIYLPEVDLFEGEIMFPSTYIHGQAGGRANASSCVRDNGRFARKQAE